MPFHLAQGATSRSVPNRAVGDRGASTGRATAPGGDTPPAQEAVPSVHTTVTPPNARAAGPDAELLAGEVGRLLYLGPTEVARLARLEARHARASAPATLRAVRTDVQRWVVWCAERGVLPLPAAPTDLADFFEVRAAVWGPATLRRIRASLARVHRVCGLADPTADEEVRVALRAAVRACADRGVGRARQAAGLTQRAADAMLARVGDRLIDRRDAALVLVARDLLARRSELVALAVGDLTPLDGGGASVLVRRGKTDQAGAGRVGYVGPDAYAAVLTWLADAGLADAPPDAPVFRAVHATGRVRATALHPQKVGEIFKRRALAAGPALRRTGVDPARVSGHSARVGMAQDLVASGLDIARRDAGRPVDVAGDGGAVHGAPRGGAGGRGALPRAAVSARPREQPRTATGMSARVAKDRD